MKNQKLNVRIKDSELRIKKSEVYSLQSGVAAGFSLRDKVRSSA